MRKPEIIRRAPIAPVRQSLTSSERPKARKPLEAFATAPDPIKNQSESIPPDESVQIELTDIQRGFRERMANEEKRFRLATDGSYYTVIAFESGEQCDAFLAYFGIGRGPGSLFVDGRPMADKLGIELPQADLRPTQNRISSKLAALALKPGER